MRSEVAHSPKPGSRLENRSHLIFWSHASGKDMSTCRSDPDPKCTVEKHRTRGTIL